jgi:Tol biopolymer transport system component
VFHIEHKNAKPRAYCSIALMNPNGGRLTDLANRRRGCDGWPSFTADGRRIVFVNYDDVKDVEVIASTDLTGGGRRDIKTTRSMGVGHPTCGSSAATRTAWRPSTATGATSAR